MKFSDQLRSEKDRLGITLAGLSAALQNISPRSIDHWLGETRTPHVWIQAEALRRLRAIKTPASDSPPNAESRHAEKDARI